MQETKNKKAQEELVGFALIVIIVAIILVFFLSFSLRSNQETEIESAEVESFIQASLQYTTTCGDEREYFSIQDLVFECNNREICLDERETCQVLEETLREIAEESWKTGQERPIKGYELNISANNEEMLSFKEGNTTSNYKSGFQNFAKSGDSIDIIFRVYY